MDRRVALKRTVALLGIITLLGALTPAASFAAPPPKARPAEVHTNRDKAKDKIHPRLLARSRPARTRTSTCSRRSSARRRRRGASRQRPHGDGAQRAGLDRRRPDRGPAAHQAGGLRGVISVKPVDLTKTGSPLGGPDPDVTRNISNAALKGAFKALKGSEVPYSAAPPLKSTNFERSRTWRCSMRAPIASPRPGRPDTPAKARSCPSSTAARTSGHPGYARDWQVRATTGWPNAFDPFVPRCSSRSGPGNVNLGLTWYTPTEAKSSFTQTVQDKKKGIVSVSYAVRRGPSRNFGAPDAKVTHTYTFPKAWTKSGTVRLGGHPDDHLLACSVSARRSS